MRTVLLLESVLVVIVEGMGVGVVPTLTSLTVPWLRVLVLYRTPVPPPVISAVPPWLVAPSAVTVRVSPGVGLRDGKMCPYSTL